ncbi:MFS transporter [Kineococcus glutinatus]|uniref:MFS transporter n=1 Tax=Kineococcus glutinatus TaxID=1070872 RepID=A0ABP9HAG7_9ACTN
MSHTAAPPDAQHASQPAHPAEPMAHRQIMEALSGLLLGMFVAILSSTVVSNALPVILADLGGGESGYTWVVTAALLATTISTPVWGKLSDLFSKKLLVQIALVLFVAASAVAGLSNSLGMLIACRVVQGLGAGGLTALAQVIMAAMIAPRERGRYSGYLGATFALATVGGPLIGGVLTEHLSWHWCFYVGVPFAVLAFFVLQKTLHLPVVKRPVRIDYLGATLIAAGVSALLVWVSLAGQQFDWWSWQTAAMVAGGVVLLALAAVVEGRVAEPIIPLRLFRSTTTTLSALASLFVGIAMFGATIFLSQYFQLARGESPTMSGILTLPMILGLFLSSTVAGQSITRTGRWKGWLVAGGTCLTAGLALMSTVEWDTDYLVVAVFMALVGIGVGAMMQNLVLAVQNVTAPQDLGTASSLVAFTRTLGGAIGVSALGAVLSHRVSHHLSGNLQALGIDPAVAGADGGGTSVPDLDALQEPVRSAVQAAFGSAIGDIFLAAAPFGLIALAISFFFKEVALRSATTATDTRTTRTDTGRTDTGLAVTGRTDTGLAVTGVVRHHDGRSIADAVVTLADATGEQVARGRTDADGRYALPAPTGGTYLLIVAALHVRPSATLVALGAGPLARDVVLSGAASVTGRVLTHAPQHRAAGATSGADAPVRPVEGALVTLTDVRGDVVATARTDHEGAYALPQLMGGSYVITAQSDHLHPVARNIDVADDAHLPCDLRLTGGGRLVGRVSAASDGHAVAEASVTLVDTEGTVVARAVTDPDGGYAFENLPAGTYTLTAAGYAPVATTVRVDEDGVAATQVELGTSR